MKITIEREEGENYELIHESAMVIRSTLDSLKEIGEVGDYTISFTDDVIIITTNDTDDS